MARFLLCIFLLLCILKAQNRNIQFEHITVDDGLSTSFVRCISQDSLGFIWIGTENGLNKYDGYKFTIYNHDRNNPASISDNLIQTLYVDHLGTLWIGTLNGLNKYDRNLDQFTRYQHDPENLNSISSNVIQCFYEDRSDVLWIGTVQGLNIYDPDSDNFSSDFLPEVALKDIRYIYEDKYKELWIGIYVGLFKYDINRRFIKKYKASKKLRFFSNYSRCGILSAPSISYITESKKGQLLIGTYHGLNKYDRIKDCFKNHFFDKHDRMGNYITKIVEDNLGNIWIGTAKGVHKISKKSLDQKKLIYESFYSSGINQSNLSSDAVYNIFIDKSGTLWIGTRGGGINKYSPKGDKFITYKKVRNNRKSLSGNFVNCFYISRSDNNKIWIGTNQGLNKFDRNTKVFKQFKHDPQNPYSLGNNHVTSIYSDTVKGRPILWLGTWSGVQWFDIQSKKFYSLDDSLENPVQIKGSGISKIIKDRRGLIWSVTANGLVNYDLRDSRKIINIFSFKDSTQGKIEPNEVNTIFEDQKGIIWIGTSDGLVYFDPVLKITKCFRYDPDLNKSISHNDISAIYEDLKGQLWVGTGFGLNKFNPETEIFDRYYENDGLPDNAIRGILEDNNGNLWISTKKGLSVFNPESEIFRNYDKYDGLQSNEFNREANYKCLKTGEMYFGGANGFNIFFPDSIKHNTYIPPVKITDIKIHNQTVLINRQTISVDSIITDSPLKKQISECDSIILSYDENYFSFEFSALDFNAPQQNQYAYQLIGVDAKWVYTDASRRFASYTQLDPGEYTFKVKGSNNDGVWNETGTSLTIIITPPWWATIWAYTLYLVLFGSIVFSVWRFQSNKLKIKHELELEHMHAEKLEEVDQMKSRFFANISHEFRTPLTLILGPVEQMLSGKYTGNLKEQYKIIIRNAKRLLQLINQLLDLSKLEAGKLKLQAEKTEIVFILKGLVQAFESLAVRKNIVLKFKSKIKSQEVYLDTDKFEKIINNLLSNAFKFTPQGGEVEVFISREDPPFNSPLTKGGHGGGMPLVQITISNTGLGISADRIDKIFNRFYSTPLDKISLKNHRTSDRNPIGQANDSYNNDSEGTGIGLALTKELVEMHHGEISVESEPDKKTTFSIIFPTGNDHLSTEEISDITPQISPLTKGGLRGVLHSEIEPTEYVGDKSITVISKSKDSPIVLIVEDNTDLRKYISSNMHDEYQIIEAKNGNQGFEKAIQKIPDLIISDVMMPEMDGFELCTKIKTDQRTSHIPVILLTARAAKEDKIEGLETGADDFIPKPFDSDELLVRVNNLIQQRQKLRDCFQKEFLLKPGEENITSIDDKFIKKVIEIVNEKITNPDFNVENLSKEIAMNRSHMSRKIHALTNQSPTELIRALRLKKAAYLLQKKSGNVAEIAFEVGFNNISYFSKCFRQQFGKSPLEYSS